MNKTVNADLYDQEELDIIAAIERGTLKEVPFTRRDREALRAVARNTLAKTRTINIRLSERDLLHLKAKASEQGLPYQTLIASILHQYGNKM